MFRDQHLAFTDRYKTLDPSADSSAYSKDIIIFVSNSELDGFREGDGDLMDKLVQSLNNDGSISAIRIIQSMSNVPDDKLDLFDQGRLRALSTDEQLSELSALQEEFLKIINDSHYEDKQKILYIGSRINIKKPAPLELGESGSLFTLDFIQRLKRYGVKIVVCCLEFKFFKRSAKQLSRAYEMLRQQLFLADGIHFLTEPDRLDFIQTIEQLEKGEPLQMVEVKLIEEKQVSLADDVSQILLSSKDIEKEEEEEKRKLEKKYELHNDIELLQINLDSLKQRAFFISGIYTVPPLNEDEIVAFGKKMNWDENENILTLLSKREPNILHFGLIRGDKGVDEAIELSMIFEELQKENKVIIAGKLMRDLGIILNMFTKIFAVEKSEFYNLLAEAIEHYKNIPITRKQARKFQSIMKLIAPNNKHSEFNEFCMQFFYFMKNKYPLKAKNLELYFDINEETLHELAMRCKYAIKFDHKGMANNASTIVTCLGFYLPVFTTCGLVTNREFANFELDGTISIERYSNVTIMPQEAYTMQNNNHEEIRPVIPAMALVADFIISESPQRYMQRLHTLQDLHDDRVFDLDEIVKNLIEQIFVPVTREKVSALPQEEQQAPKRLGMN